MAGTLDTSELLALLNAGETVVLPTQRAAQAMRGAFDAAQRTRGQQAWEPPPLHSWRTWIEALWSRLIVEGTDDRLLLNRLQEETLWAEIVAASPSGSSLSGGALRNLSQLAASAFELCSAYHAGPEVHRAADTHDSRAFAEWHATFVARCREEKLLSRSLLGTVIAEHARAGRLRLPDALHLAGFAEKTPAQGQCLAALGSGGVEITDHRLVRSGPPAGPPLLVACPDPVEEARWAIRWAGAYLREHETHTIALVYPDPGAERAELEPALREILAPELQAVDVDLSSTPWQFSGGYALSDTPLVRDALTLLRWLDQELPLEQVSRLLLSPYFAHRSTPEERVRFELDALRRTRRLRPELGLGALLQLTRGGGARGGARIQLNGFEAAARILGDGQPARGLGGYADWAELVRKVLRAAGWPGERPLSAQEFRATEAWDGLLDLLSTLDFRRQRIGFRDFFEVLGQEAQEQQHGESGSTRPVNILPLDELEGCSFDAVLFLRATDAHLPAPERLHPLLGRTLQRSLQLPGGDPSLTYRRVYEKVGGLRERSGQLLLTWPEADENGPLRPSCLAFDLGAHPVVAEELLPPAEPEPEILLQAVNTPRTALPLPVRNVSGGARVLELQAKCGFRAFASMRLGASAPDTQTLGMDARDRGNVLHWALELFWTEVKTQAALRSLTAEQRSDTLRRCVAGAFARQRHAVDPDDAWALSFLQLSEERLVRLLEQWLRFELGRGDFTVQPPEQEQQVQIGPLELTVRPDRIDQVEGGFVFIDYKTSFDLHTKHWIGERPDAPQLPLYTLLREPEALRGLAFAQLRPGQKMGWVGLQKQTGDLHTDRTTKLHDLELQVQLWREELSRLAHAFAEGVTDVDPKSYPHTCRFCEQRLLCRLDRSALLAQDEDQDEAIDELAGRERDG